MSQQSRGSLVEAAKQQARHYVRRALDDDAVLVIGLFAGCVLVNGILAILLIELLQSLGLWSPISGGEPTSMADWRPHLPGRT